MKIYLNEKINSIPVINNMMKLLESIYMSNINSNKLLDINEITARHFYDPVREFISYYNSGLKDQLTEDQITYVVNSIYKSKGSLYMFTILNETLTDIHLTIKYEYPVIEILNIDNARLSDVDQFVNKLVDALYYSIYFSDINVTFKNLILNINEVLYTKVTNKILEFRKYTIDSSNVEELDII